MQVFIGIGSNLGDRMMYISKAIEMLGDCIKKVSSIYETEPEGIPGGDKFLNTVAEIETDMEPFELLDFLEDIERKLGRRRAEKGKYKSRTIDLDILLYGDINIDTPKLTIPHPKLKDRDFVLTPLKELCKQKI